MNLTGAFSCIMAAMWLLCKQCETAPEMVDGAHRRLRNRPVLRGYAIDELIEEEDDDFLESNKRQQFDDYGHMRFGKRGKFDDYGHMRFGRHHD